MMRPNFCLRITGQAALVQAYAPLTWTCSMMLHSASVMALNDLSLRMPALLMRICALCRQLPPSTFRHKAHINPSPLV